MLGHFTSSFTGGGATRVCEAVRDLPLHFHPLELELSGELILDLLQLLSAPHVLVVHVLDLRFDALELRVQLGGQAGREKEREREGGAGE